ncbi:MAG: vWA domain-containing protein [bacterium]
MQKRKSLLAYLSIPLLVSFLIFTGCERKISLEQKLPEKLETDQAFIDLKINLLDNGPQQLNQTGDCELILKPNIRMGEFSLELSAAGSIIIQPFDDFQKKAPGQGMLKDIPVHTRFQTIIHSMEKDEQMKIRIPFKLEKPGYGYMAVRLLSPEGKPAEYSNGLTLYALGRNDRIFYSEHSIMDLDAQSLRDELERKGMDKETIEYEIKKLKRGGASLNKSSREGTNSSKRLHDGQSYNSVTIDGHIRFTDSIGGVHPVRFATVNIMDQEAIPPDQLVVTTQTDENGFYSVTVDDNDGDGTGRDIYVVVRADGDTVQVEDYGINHDVATGDVWELDSNPPVVDVQDNTTQTINITATNNVVSPQNVAFELYEAMNTISRYLPELGEPLPAKLPIRYPRFGSTVASFSPTDIWIKIPDVKVHDWDVHHHEYGHYIQHIYGTADNPGGPHSSCNNLCVTKGDKDQGVRMSWAESWPTFFGTMAQNEMGLDALGIPNLGDVRYTCPTNGLDYDLEDETDGCNNGEGCERALMRIFWDLYDNANDDGDQDVNLGAQDLWDVIKDNQPLTFSSFWNYLTLDKTEAERIAYGRICTRYGIAPETTIPADGTVYAGGASPTFQWNGNMGCDTGGNARYSIRFYNNDLTALIYSSPWQNGTSFIPSGDQINQIFVGPDSTLRWIASSKDLSAPETGAYYGNPHTIVDNYDVPDRNPVDIILALDLSGSMANPVPGSDFPMSKLELLQQATEVFIRTWAMHAIDGDRLGVIYFSTHTSSVAGAVSPYLVGVATDAETIINDIKGKTAGVCTAIGGAIQVGFNSLTDGDNKKVMLLFSDGEQTKNPFVDEEGIPSRLKIRQVPDGGTVPFGGYWCGDSGLANNPEGNPIVPDGTTLEGHHIQIHTIGVGVAGADFEELIERMASETDALHHYTSLPDEDLDIFFTNDLINSLKTGTLEIVKTEQGNLSPKETRHLSIPVNLASKSLTLVLSWKGESNPDAILTTITLPDGSTATADKTDRGPFFSIHKFEFPYETKDSAYHSHNGNWLITLQGQSRAELIKYQVTAIVDEPCFDYEFDFPRTCYCTGDRIILRAKLLQDNKPLRKAEGIWVDIASPAYSSMNIQAKYLPQIDMKRDDTRMASMKRKILSWLRRNKDDFTYQDRLTELLRTNPEVARLLNAKRSDSIRLYDDGQPRHGDKIAGDGIYSNIYPTTRVPGNYQFKLNIIASSACGRVERSAITSTLVRVKDFDLTNSFIAVKTIEDGLYAILIKPQDRFGNLLGPGHGRDIKIYSSSGRLTGNWNDNLDGIYYHLIKAKPGDNPRINIRIHGRDFMQTNLATLAKMGKKTSIYKI